MTTIEEAKQHLQSEIDRIAQEIDHRASKLGTYSTADMKFAVKRLLKISEGSGKISDLSIRDRMLVCQDNDYDRLKMLTASLAKADTFIVGVENMPADAYKRKWASPAGFDPQDHYVFVEIES